MIIVRTPPGLPRRSMTMPTPSRKRSTALIQVVSDWRHPDVEADDADRPAPVLDAASFDSREERRQVSELDHRAALRLPHDRADGGGVRAVAEFDLLGDADATAHQARAQCPHAERGPRRDVF